MRVGPAVCAVSRGESSIPLSHIGPFTDIPLAAGTNETTENLHQRVLQSMDQNWLQYLHEVEKGSKAQDHEDLAERYQKTLSTDPESGNFAQYAEVTFAM